MNIIFCPSFKDRHQVSSHDDTTNNLGDAEIDDENELMTLMMTTMKLVMTTIVLLLPFVAQLLYMNWNVMSEMANKYVVD